MKAAAFPPPVRAHQCSLCLCLSLSLSLSYRELELRGEQVSAVPVQQLGGLRAQHLQGNPSLVERADKGKPSCIQ